MSSIYRTYSLTSLKEKATFLCRASLKLLEAGRRSDFHFSSLEKVAGHHKASKDSIAQVRRLERDVERKKRGVYAQLTFSKLLKASFSTASLFIQFSLKIAFTNSSSSKSVGSALCSRLTLRSRFY
eukprot:IDg2775t1